VFIRPSRVTACLTNDFEQRIDLDEVVWINGYTIALRVLLQRKVTRVDGAEYLREIFG